MAVGSAPVEPSIETSRISKAGPAHLRAKLYMPAGVASQHNAQARALYERLVAAGKAKKAVLAR